MQTLSKLSSTFILLGLVFSALAQSYSQPRRLQKRLQSICDLVRDNIFTVIPSDIHDGQAYPLLPPSATFVVLSAGVANYTCLPDGTWL